MIIFLVVHFFVGRGGGGLGVRGGITGPEDSVRKEENNFTESLNHILLRMHVTTSHDL